MLNVYLYICDTSLAAVKGEIPRTRCGTSVSKGTKDKLNGAFIMWKMLQECIVSIIIILSMYIHVIYIDASDLRTLTQ